MDYCTFCPKMCRFSCPVSEASRTETYTPWGKMEIGRWLLDKSLPLSEEIAKAAYQCTNCLHCQQYCEHHNDVPSALREVRRLAVDNYAAPPAAFELEVRFAEFNNPYGHDLMAKLREGDPTKIFKKKAKAALFPSCHTLHLFPTRVQTYRDLFRKLKIDSVTLMDEAVQCCGAPLNDLGFEEEFEEIAEIQHHAFQPFTWVVTDGPECCQTFRQRYPDLGVTAGRESLHLLEFLAPYFQHQNYRSRGKVNGRVAYLDPPFLSRHLGIIDIPRRILAELTGFPPIELSMSGKDAPSVGTEASYDLLFPELSDKIASKIVDEVSSRGISKLITADAKAEAKLRHLAQGFEVQDIFEFFNEQILKK